MLRGTKFGSKNTWEQRARDNSNIVEMLLESTGLSQGSPNQSQHNWKLWLLYELGMEEKRAGGPGRRGKIPYLNGAEILN